jgi:hypothetical protein
MPTSRCVLIEVTALAIFAYWGWKARNGAMRWAIAVGAVAAAVVVWALFVSEDPAVAIRDRCSL